MRNLINSKRRSDKTKHLQQIPHVNYSRHTVCNREDCCNWTSLYVQKSSMYNTIVLQYIRTLGSSAVQRCMFQLLKIIPQRWLRRALFPYEQHDNNLWVTMKNTKWRQLKNRNINKGRGEVMSTIHALGPVPCSNVEEAHQAGQISLLEKSFTSSTILNLVSIRDMVSFPKGLQVYQTALSALQVRSGNM